MPDTILIQDFNTEPDVSDENVQSCEGDSFTLAQAVNVCFQSQGSGGKRSTKVDPISVSEDLFVADVLAFDNSDCTEPFNLEDSSRNINITLGECGSTGGNSILTYEKDLDLATINVLVPTSCSELAETSYAELASDPDVFLADFLSIPFDEERCLDVSLINAFSFETNLTLPSGAVVRSVKSTASATLTGYSEEGCEGKNLGSVLNQCLDNTDGGLIYFGGQNMTDFSSSSNEDTILGFTYLEFGLIVGGGVLALAIVILTLIKIAKPKSKSGAVVVGGKPI